MGDIFLRAAWRHLLVLNYEVEPALAGRYVPAGTTLDLEAGRCFASIVAFRFERARVWRIAIPFHTTFPEVNLRIYVVRDTPQGPRRGVVFVREFVNRPLVAAVARRFFNESFRTMTMRCRIDAGKDGVAAGGRIEYRWRPAGRWNEASAARDGPWRSVHDDRHVEFIAEHYYGYGRARSGRTTEFRVDHPPWRYAAVRDVRFDCDAAKLYGRKIAAALHRRPYSAFLLDGSAVTVTRPRAIECFDPTASQEQEAIRAR
jgi:uncharacterized protein YqjF (DUF2071 family)